MDLLMGQWIRYYTNSIRGAGSSTHIGKITEIETNKEGQQIHVTAGYAQVHVFDVVALLVVDEVNRRIISEETI